MTAINSVTSRTPPAYTPVKDLTQEWEKEKTRAKVAYIAQLPLSLTPFLEHAIDYSNPLTVIKISNALLTSNLSIIERRAYMTVTKYWRNYYNVDYCYTLSNLVSYKILDESDAFKIRNLLAQKKICDDIIDNNWKSYKLAKASPQSITNSEEIIKITKTAQQKLEDLEADWIAYRDIVIKSRLPVIQITL